MDNDYYEALELDDPPQRHKRIAKQPKPTKLADSADDSGTSKFAHFYHEELIVGEPKVVKSGKEATLFCVKAHPRLQRESEWLAIKWYRPREHRTFKQLAIYQQGRTTLNSRADRAIANHTRKGQEMQFGLWIGSEFGTLQALYREGADVPEPVALSQDAILMEYFGEPGHAAPQLYNVVLPKETIGAHFSRLLDNLQLFLEKDRVHGDLSPYNILYWKERLVIIDFPQATDPLDNPNAYGMFLRDLSNIYEYFQPYGVECDVRRLGLKMWLDSGRAHPKHNQYLKDL